MNATRTAPITVEQYENFKGYPGLRDELIFGEIVMSPTAKPLHQETARTIERLLNALVDGGPYIARQDANIKFTELNSMPSPDVFVVRRDVWFEACRHEEYVSIPPVLAVEVLSPANRKPRIAQKVEIYLAAHVLSVWTVDPKRQTVYVHTSQSKTERQLGDSIDLPEPLHGSVALADIFRLE